MLDKSGNDYHLTEATTASKFVYQTDGTLHWLLGDNTDDRITGAGTMPFSLPSYMIAGFSRGVDAGSSDMIGINGTGTWHRISGSSAGRTEASIRFASGAVPIKTSPLSTWVTGVPAIGESYAQVGTVDFATNGVNHGTTAHAYTNQSATCFPQLNSDGAGFLTKFFGWIVIHDDMTVGTRRADIQAWMAAKTGVTL
jgi:hypothetical protein